MAKDYWWQTENGIRAHFSEEREALNEDYQRRLKRCNDTELQLLDALEANKDGK